MEKFNNHGLDVINSRVCMALALDDFDDEEQIKHVKSKQVQNGDYPKEYLDYLSYLKKVYNIGGLTEEEQDFVISLLHTYQVNYTEIAELITAEVIANFCNVIDSNKKFPELYQADKTETKKELCIRFAKEDELPKAEVGDLPSMEYFGYYDSKENQIILCPERIKNATELFKKKGVHVTQQVTTSQPVTTFHALYGMVFIHALSHAVLDCTNKIAEKGSIAKCDNLYQNIDPDLLSEEKEKQQVMLYQFMEESVATIMTLYYYSKVNQQYEKELREWLSYLPQEYKIGLVQFDMLNNGSDLVENYCAAWRGRKKALKIYCSVKNELSDLKSNK